MDLNLIPHHNMYCSHYHYHNHYNHNHLSIILYLRPLIKKKEKILIY